LKKASSLWEKVHSRRKKDREKERKKETFLGVMEA
jgi:hypothetical protein